MGLPPAHYKVLSAVLNLNCAGGCPDYLRPSRTKPKKAKYKEASIVALCYACFHSNPPPRYYETALGSYGTADV